MSAWSGQLTAEEIARMVTLIWHWDEIPSELSPRPKWLRRLA